MMLRAAFHADVQPQCGESAGTVLIWQADPQQGRHFQWQLQVGRGDLS
jgi:hypothetical protein